MLETFVDFSFEAAHTTPPFPHPHGHSFLARVVFTGEPDPVYGWSHDLREVEPLIEAVRQELDHKYLNDIPGLSMPSNENVARWIWERLDGSLSGLDRVTLSRGLQGRTEGCTYRGAPKAVRAGP